MDDLSHTEPSESNVAPTSEQSEVRVQMVKLAKLLVLYKPNVPQGNFQPDISNRGANDMLVRVAVALGICPEERIRTEFRRLDAEAFEREQAFIDRLEAERG